MKRRIFKFLALSVPCGFYALSATAAVSLFSNYGQIQNVQNYSSNPFWSPNAPYNQRLPQPVFATGADLNSKDCLNVVQSLVAAQCMARNNCKNSDLSDIRPVIMVQLSNLPGHNYVSACGGYIDGVFESYVKNYGNTVSNREIAFPDSTIPNPDINNSNNLQFQNPYKAQPTKWQQEIKERSDELQSLQNQNGANGYGLSSTEFPKTYADLSFSERIENERTGLMPYKDLKAYKPLNVKTAEEWCAKDGEHYNSNECWNWRCGLNGREAQTANCISYRCSKSDYYAAHEDECKRHELCSGNKKNSDECMRYRCYVAPDQDFEDCKRWKCTHDDTFKSENEDMCNGYECDINYVSTSSDACKQLLCGTCTETAFTPGQYSTHPNCKDYLCNYCTPYYNDNVTLCQPPQDSGESDDPQDSSETDDPQDGTSVDDQTAQQEEHAYTMRVVSTLDGRESTPPENLANIHKCIVFCTHINAITEPSAVEDSIKNHSDLLYPDTKVCICSNGFLCTYSNRNSSSYTLSANLTDTGFTELQNAIQLASSKCNSSMAGSGKLRIDFYKDNKKINSWGGSIELKS